MKNLLSIKEAARRIVAALLEAENTEGYFEYQVYPAEKELADDLTFNIQVPTPEGTFVNKIYVADPLDENGIAQIERRMSQLAKQRKYPTGSFFIAPWGMYLIHGGTIGKV